MSPSPPHINELPDVSATSSSDSSSEDEVDITERTDIPSSMQPQIERLRLLRTLVAQSSLDNKRDMYAEHQRNHENPQRQRKSDAQKRKAQIQSRRDTLGASYERSRFMEYSIDQVAKYEERKREREDNRERGFTDYAQVNQKKYERDVAKIKPDLAKSKPDLAKCQGEYVDDEKAVTRLAKHVRGQQEKRAKLHKPSVEKEGEHVSYINQKNARFNRKMNRAYDKHTQEIRDNLERGTAL
ncbi:pre-mRNA-splicing factor SYF2 [Coemansia sp. RSA 1822]|nr:pre-mRNA-splicing factor SYF2 [Coemansia sp. RSA 638]KAJ2118706.1 pre-mRNA-splicing factor SYF2 [Coemansia sp. RSA 720]KAJ2539096.1 pre-mRNA-splicing factor SYF2 [Coemansia sp. RSA 1853]KAJ2566869.1 pre-mRNA-splicing factor SYF2 [Coemansia sp. RSA 1822]